jgi:ATP/maltotriose-dependent transcriptional regulator MalT
MAMKGTAQKKNGLPSHIEAITRREFEILRLISRGLSNKEIAHSLVIAPSTVKTHTSNLFGKLGVQRRTQAIALARELELV